MATLLEGIQQEREEERLEQQQAQVEADVISSQVHGMTKAEALAFVGVLGLKDTYRGIKQILGVDTEDLKEEQEKLNLILQQYGAEAFAAFAGGAILDPVGWIIPVGKARTVGKLAIMGAAFAGGSSFLGYTDENTIERRLVNAGIGTVAGGVATPILGKSFQGISALAQKGRTSFAGRSGRLLELEGEDAFGFEKGFNFKEAVKSVSDLPNKRRVSDPIKGLYQDVLGKPLKNFVFNHPGAMITGGIGGVAGADYGDYTVDKNVEQWTIDYAEGNISKQEYDQKLKDFKENEDSIRRNARIMGFVTGAILGVGVKRTVAGLPAGKLTSLFGGKERDLTIGEYLSRGLFDNYGLEPDYIALKEMSNLQGNHIMKQLATVSDQVSHLTRDQRKVMTDVLDGKEDFLPNDVNHLDDAFMDQLDKTGQSLIDFGMISVEELQKRITRYAFSLQNRGLDSKQAVTRLTEISNSKISQINSRADIRRFTLSKQIDNLNRRKVKLQAKALKQEETEKEIFDTEDARELDELIPSKIDKLEADMLNTNLDRVDAIKEAKVDLRAQLAKERARNLEFKEGLVSGKLTDQDIENKLLRLSTISNNLNNRGLRMDIRINEVKGFLQEGWTLEQIDKPILGHRALNRIANAEARALERGATKEEIDRISDAAVLRETQKAQLRMLKEGDARIVEDTVTIRRQLKPDEKIAMGELDDASYVIGRFGRLLADDVQKFRFYHSLNKEGFGLTEQEAKTINDAVNPLSKDDIESIRKILLSKFRAGTGEERALSSEQIERLVSIEKYLSEKNKNVLRNILSERVKKVQGQAAFTEEEVEGIISNISSFDRTSILASFPDFVQKAVARGENFVQVPTTISNRLNVPTYGDMAGLWVPENVLSDLQWSNSFYKMMNDGELSSVLRGLRTLQRTWKASKTAWNPTVHMNNIMGNVVLYDFHDANWKFIGPSARELFKVGVLGKPSKLIDDAKTAGVFGADFVTRELGAAEGRLLREYGNKNWTDNIEGSLGIAATIADTIAKRTKKAVGVRTGYLARLYQSEDSVFRLAAFQTKLEQGFSPQEAARFARKAFVDYNINAPLINVMRETTTPFLAYSYRIMPIIAESAIMKPWKLAKYAALGYGLNAIGTDVTNSDESAIRAVLPERFRGNIWGDPTGILPPRFISMPITVNGVPQYKDFTRWIPGGDVFEMGKGLIPYIPRPLQPNGGLWGAIATGLMGYDNFTGKEIPGLGFGESRDLWSKVQFIGDSLIPNFPFVPGAPSTVKINRAFVKGQVNPFIDPIPVWQAIMQSVGIKLTPANVDTLTTSTLAEYGGQLNSARQGMVNLIKGLQQNQISMEQYEKGILRIEAIVSRLTEELNKKLEPQKKTKQNKQEGGFIQGLAEGGFIQELADGGPVDDDIPSTLGSNILKFTGKFLSKVNPVGQAAQTFFGDLGTIEPDDKELALLRRQEAPILRKELLKRFNDREGYDSAVQRQQEKRRGVELTQNQLDYIKTIKQAISEMKFHKEPTFKHIQDAMKEAEGILYPDGAPLIGARERNTLNSIIEREAKQKFRSIIQTKPSIYGDEQMLDPTDQEFADTVVSRDTLEKLKDKFGSEVIEEYHKIVDKYFDTRSTTKAQDSIDERKALLGRLNKLLNPGSTLVEGREPKAEGPGEFMGEEGGAKDPLEGFESFVDPIERDRKKIEIAGRNKIFIDQVKNQAGILPTTHEGKALVRVLQDLQFFNPDEYAKINKDTIHQVVEKLRELSFTNPDFKAGQAIDDEGKSIELNHDYRNNQRDFRIKE